MENDTQPRGVRQILWKCLDGFICIFIVAPLVVFYWRGSFQLLDHYVLGPEQQKLSSTITLVIGICGTIAANVLQTILHQRIHVKRKGFLQLFLKRIYTYCFGWIIVNHWRGVWRMWDAFTGMGMISNVVCFTSGCFLLLVLKSFRNVVAPPLVTVSDFDASYFFIKTRFRRKPFTAGYFLDTIFSIVVPGSLVVFVWRGMWGIFDNADVNLWRNYPKTSFGISAGVGFGIVVNLFALQYQMGKISAAIERKGWYWLKIVFEDLFFFIAAVGAINIWRGVWGLCDELILKDQWALSNWICHIVGGFGTMLLLHGNSVLVRNVEIDGEYTNGEGCRFFSRSLTFFEKRADKQKRRQQALANGVPAGKLEKSDLTMSPVDDERIYRKLPAANPADIEVKRDQLEKLLSTDV